MTANELQQPAMVVGKRSYGKCRFLSVVVASTFPERYDVRQERERPSMDITFACDKCGQPLAIEETGAGQLVDCPKCGTCLEVPNKAKVPTPSLPEPPVLAPPAEKNARIVPRR